MAFKVVATPFGRRVETEYPYEHEALRPLGITITTAEADSDAEYIAQVKDADAIMAGGRMLTADIISQLEHCKVIANGGVGVDRVDLDAATADGHRRDQRARRVHRRSRQPRHDAAAVPDQEDASRWTAASARAAGATRAST